MVAFFVSRSVECANSACRIYGSTSPGSAEVGELVVRVTALEAAPCVIQERALDVADPELAEDVAFGCCVTRCSSASDDASHPCNAQARGMPPSTRSVGPTGLIVPQCNLKVAVHILSGREPGRLRTPSPAVRSLSGWGDRGTQLLER
jgi:hypothetical protein